MSRPSLRSRPLDLVYFVFFLLHIPQSIIGDFQALYPTTWVPAPIRKLLADYAVDTSDLMASAALGHYAGDLRWAWIQSFYVLEAVFQFPVFFIGAYGLYRGSKRIYPLLLIYGASTATTVLPCLVTVLSQADPSTLTFAPSSTSGLLHLGFTATREQKLKLLGIYLPWIIVPFGMMVDMALRLSALVEAGECGAEERKRR